MIILTDLAHKLEEILNSSNIASVFQFVVKSQGYHLDSIADQKTGKNTIPVFIGVAGGEYNAVPNLKQVNFNYSISIWFPVRFKESFYLLNEYLEETFVAKTIDIKGQKALCNISIAEYSEITDVHLDQFEEWVEDTYEGAVRVMKKEHDISEEYMAMTFNLYATTLGDGFSFGNDVKYEFECEFEPVKIVHVIINGVKYERRGSSDDKTIDNVYYYSFYRLDTSTLPYIVYITYNPAIIDGMKKIINDPDVYTYTQQDGMEKQPSYKLTVEEFSNYGSSVVLNTSAVRSQSGTGATISPIAQQPIVPQDELTNHLKPNFARNITHITNFNKSIVIYPKENEEFWNYFMFYYNTQFLSRIDNCYLVKKYGDGSTYKYKQIILTVNENIQLGEPLSFTITFGDSI